MNNSTQIPIGIQERLPDTMTVCVSGVSSGIGAAQAAAFLKAGHRLFGIDRQETPAVIKLSQVYPKQFYFKQADLSSIEEVNEAIETFNQHFTCLHVLCNTAGRLDQFLPLDQTSPELFDQILKTNLYSMFYLTKGLLPLLLAQKSSRLINMASIAGLGAGGGGIAYTASKHAIIGFTKQMAYDYAKHGLRANAIAPGAIATPMNAADFEGDHPMAQWVCEQTPNQRWAAPEEVAQLTLFLASDGGDYIQGSVLPIDGGWMNR